MNVSLTRAALMLVLARRNAQRVMFPSGELRPPTDEELRDAIVQRSILNPSDRVVLHWDAVK